MGRLTGSDTVVDMTDIQNPKGFTSLGYPRDSRKYWDIVLSRDQEADPSEQVLSGFNRHLIENGYAPLVDDQWVEHHPDAADFKWQELHHHHWDQGPLAVALPEGFHERYSDALHWVTQPDADTGPHIGNETDELGGSHAAQHVTGSAAHESQPDAAAPDAGGGADLLSHSEAQWLGEPVTSHEARPIFG